MDPFPEHEPGETNKHNVAEADQEADTEAVEQEATHANQDPTWWTVQNDDKKRAISANSHLKLFNTTGELIAYFSHRGCGTYEFIERKIC